MNFHQPEASLHFPDPSHGPGQLDRTTHLGIGAHADDLEFMALHGIIACHQHPDRHFVGVTCTDGARAPRSGRFASVSDAELAAIRAREQIRAAELGRYLGQIQLAYPGLETHADRLSLQAELVTILKATRPDTVYTHNPLDKHPTHLAVFAATIGALRELPESIRPRKVLGCEVWRGLDWLPDSLKSVLDVTDDSGLSRRLAEVFESQLSSKRYDLAVHGRSLANATFSDPNGADSSKQASYALDLTPLIENPETDPLAFALGFIDAFREEAAQALGRTLR